MKKIFLSAVIALSVACFSACNNPNQQEDSKSSADSLNNMKDTVADPSKSITKDLVIKVSKGDARFAVEAASGGLAEVALGELAQQKAENPQVKDFGVMMINDHTKANNEMKALSAKKGISLPATLSDPNQKLKDDLSSKTGKDFDKAYVKDMIEDHKEDIKVFEEAAKNLNDPELKTFATITLPVLRKHLDAIEKIGQAMDVK
jgi:putative membrane protein